MSKYVRYARYISMVFLGVIIGPPIIDPNDPLERKGPLSIKHFSEEIPFNMEDRSEVLEAEMFAPIERQPYAMVLFMPGFGFSYSSYEVYLEHLASHGFLCLGMNFAGPAFSIDGEHDIKALQAVAAIRYVQKTYPIYNELPVYTSGHSLGGKIAFYAASIDNSIAGTLALDPVNAGGPPCAVFPNQCTKYPVAPNPETGQVGLLSNFTGPSLIMRSAPAPANPDEQFNAEHFYFGIDGEGQDATPSPSLYYNFGDLPHLAYLPCLPSEQVQIVKRTMVAWLFNYAVGIDFKEYLTGEKIQDDIEKQRLESIESR